MAYDDVKRWGDRSYSGMRVGGRHEWDYPHGRWEERKLAPDQWSFTFDSTKRRRHRAPIDSGAPAGTMFHWLTVAHQRVRKVDANTYETFMEGAKWKVGHRRPGWRKWSTEYRGRDSARAQTIRVLEETLERLRLDEAMRAPRLETMLDRRVLGARDHTLDEWDPAPDERDAPIDE